MAEQRKMLTQSMMRKRTPNTTQSHSNQEGPSSQSPVDAGKYYKDLRLERNISHSCLVRCYGATVPTEEKYLLPERLNVIF